MTDQQKSTAEEPKIGRPVELAPIQRLLLTPEEAAGALGISPRLLWSLTRDGTIPAVRLRRTVRYSPVALARWLASQNSP